MLDLNDLRIFDKVAAAQSFTAAARALGLPKSAVSRSVARLEKSLGSRLLQRSTRDVVLTDPGRALLARCAEILRRVGDITDYFDSLVEAPRGILRISCGIGFGMNVLSELLPAFLRQHPAVDVALDMTSRTADLIADEIDVAIRMGPLADSTIVVSRLGRIFRYPCAAPEYLERRGRPTAPQELSNHDAVELPGASGRPRSWSFTNSAGETVEVPTRSRLSVNDPATIHRLVVNGAGVGALSGYLCAPDIKSGRLIHLIPEWRMPAIDVSAVFPSHRELSPVVRAFIDFLKQESAPGRSWQSDPLREGD